MDGGVRKVLVLYRGSPSIAAQPLANNATAAIKNETMAVLTTEYDGILIPHKNFDRRTNGVRAIPLGITVPSRRIAMQSRGLGSGARK